jgi:hypothetical protein
MPKHYRKSPSSLSRVFACPGSYWASAGKGGSTSSSYAEEGTLAHDLASHALYTCELDRLNAPNAEMQACVEGYVEFCQELYRQGDGWESIEETMIASGIEDLGGTADYITCYEENYRNSPSRDVLHLVDFKYGIGVAVPCEANPQLLAYLWLAREKYGWFGVYRATIWQPRTPGPPEDTCDFTDADLDAWEAQLSEATDPKNKGEFSAGIQCRWCPASSTCDHLFQVTMDAARIELDEGDKIEDKWVSLMKAKPAIEKLLKEVPKRMADYLLSGKKLPGWKLVNSRGNRRWSVSDDKVMKKLRRNGVGFKKSAARKLMSPTQLEKAGYGDLIEGLHIVTRPQKGPTMVPDSDKRQGIECEDPVDSFREASILPDLPETPEGKATL